MSQRSKLRTSCTFASAICLVAIILGVVEAAGLWQIVHPLFWVPFAIGGLGVAGSNAIYLRRL